MLNTRSYLLFLPALLLAGCSNPADKVAGAKVSSTNGEAVSAQSAPAVEARSYAVSQDNSTIGFVASKVTGSHNGGFKKFEGQLSVVNGKLAGSGSKVVINMDSIWADNNQLTGHLKSPDFFNAQQIPTATFATTAVTDQSTNSLVTGDLTLHGVTKQIAFPAQIKVSDDVVELQAEFFINRFDFEVKYPGKANDLIRKEVVLKLNVKAARMPGGTAKI